MSEARLSDFESMPWERVHEDFERKLVWGDRIMMAQLRLRAGCRVPRHHHPNEQLSYVVSGRLRFLVGDSPEPILVGPGQVLHLPSEIPHSAEAVEDTFGIDLFSPPRQDWLDGSDDYLRR